MFPSNARVIYVTLQPGDYLLEILDNYQRRLVHCNIHQMMSVVVDIVLEKRPILGSRTRGNDFSKHVHFTLTPIVDRAPQAFAEAEVTGCVIYDISPFLLSGLVACWSRRSFPRLADVVDDPVLGRWETQRRDISRLDAEVSLACVETGWG